MKNILMVSGAALVLIVVSTALSYFLITKFVTDPQNLGVNSKSELEKPDAEASKGEPEKTVDPIYYSFEKPIIINYTVAGRTRYLQITLDVMLDAAESKEVFQKNMPVILNDLVFLLSAYEFEQLGTVEGKQKARKDMLGMIQKTVKERTGKEPVKEIFFTSFVMQ